MAAEPVRMWQVVTGSTQGIGRSIAEALATDTTSGVLLAVRNVAAGELVAGSITAKTGNTHVRPVYVDVSDRSAVVSLGRRLREEGLAVCALVNNAAECPRERAETAQGIERQWSTNVLGYHWLLEELQDILVTTARASGVPSRVVNVASDWAGDLDLGDVEFKRRRYDSDTAYRQSKQANRMLTVSWAERLDPEYILINACHPGDPCTTLSCALGYNTTATKDCTAAAALPSFLASRQFATQTKERVWTGLWFPSGRKPSPCHFAGGGGGGAQRAALWELLQTYCHSSGEEGEKEQN